MPFTHLYIETNYAMNGSTIRIEELVKQAVSYGYSSLAITDPKMYGVIKFYKECKKNNIKPIIGLNVYIQGITPGFKNHVLLYAKNNIGYQNLLRLASYADLTKEITLNDFKANNDGIISVILSDESELVTYYKNNQINEMAEFNQMIKTHFNDVFLSTSSDSNFNNQFSRKYRLIFVPKVNCLYQNDGMITETLQHIFNIKSDDLLGNKNVSYFMSNEEIKEHYNVTEQLISAVDYIEENCNVEIKFGETQLPKYKLKKNVSSKDYLHALVSKGLTKRLKGMKVDKKVYLNRLEYELKVIDEMGYNDYFLIVWDFVKYAKQKKYLVGPGRGSAAASLVSYCLGITSVDSIKYGLVFERFLNPERITLPDIDMDIPDDKRDDVITYVRDLYGIDRVASICTFGTFLSKSAIRDTARVLDFEGVLLNQIVKETTDFSSIKEMMDKSDLIKNIISQNNDAKKLLDISKEIEGLHRHTSTHAAGIIVTEDKMTNHTAVQAGLLDMMQTQYEAKDLESLGL